MDYILQLFSGNIGIIVVLFIAWKTGFLQYLIKLKNNHSERNFDDGQPLVTLKEVASKMVHLEQHFNDTTTVLLQEISQNTKDIKDTQQNIYRKLEVIISTQNEILKYGVLIRK